MESRENESFVVYAPSLSGGWTLTIDCEAERIAETYDELLEICDGVFYAAKGFLTPTVVSYALNEFTEDLDTGSMYDTGPTSIWKDEIQSTEGLDYEKIAGHIGDYAETLGGIVSIAEVKVEAARVAVSLSDRDVEISRETEELYRWMNHGELVDRRPVYDPLEITVLRRNEVPSGKPVYKVCVDIHSDIWYENDEIGERNRALLADFLRRLYVVLNPRDVDFHAERGSPFDSFYKQTGEEHDLPFE